MRFWVVLALVVLILLGLLAITRHNALSECSAGESLVSSEDDGYVCVRSRPP